MRCLPLKCTNYQIVSQEGYILLHVTCLFVLGMQPSEYREAIGIASSQFIWLLDETKISFE